MRVFLAILVAITVAAIPVVWQLTLHFMAEAKDTPISAAAPEEAQAFDPTLALRQDMQAMRAELLRLQQRVDAIDARTSAPVAASQVAAAPLPSAQQSDTLKDAFANVVLIGGRRTANEGLTVASPRFLRQMFGLPRSDLSDDCQPATNAKLRSLLVTESVGPIRVRMLKPATASLRRVFEKVREFEPELYARIKSSGSLCVRFIRGSTTAASAHAYGLAVDINIDGKLDNFADGKTQLGLILMADFFKEEGWIWGAGFGREDSMHFEVSRETLQQWRDQGLI